MRISKKILAIALSILMAVSMMPFTVFAATTRTVATGADLKTAVAAAEDGDTIQFVNDLTLTAAQVGFKVDKSLTFDLNGCTISGPANGSVGKTVDPLNKTEVMFATGTQANPITVTFKDSQGGGSWTYTYSGNSAAYFCDVRDYATVVVESGTYTANGLNYAGSIFYVRSANAALDIEDGTFEIKNGAKVDNAVYANNGTTVINGGTFNANNSTDNSVNINSSATVTINDGDFNAKASVPSSSTKITVNGGTFNNYDGSASTAVANYTSDDKVIDTVTGEVVDVAATTVAKIGNNEYATLEDAIAAVPASGTIKLIDDVTVAATIEITDGKKFTINTNGHEISSAVRVFNIRHGGVTISGTGVLSTTAANAAVAVYGSTNSADSSYSTFTLQTYATINAPNGYGVMIGANGTSSFGSVVTIYGTINSKWGVYINGNVAQTDSANAPKFTIGTTSTAASISSSNADSVIYAAGYANWTINNANLTGGSSIYIKSGNMTIKKGTFTANAAKTDYAFNPSGCDITGDCVIIDSCGYPGSIPTVSITGGTFTSANGAAVASYAKQDDPRYTDATYPVVDEIIPANSTAVFSSDVSELAECGYVTEYDATAGGYVVEQRIAENETSIKVADTIKEKFYLDKASYHDSAVAKITYNHNSDASQSASVSTDVVTLGSLPEEGGKAVFEITQAPAQVTETVKIEIFANADATTPVFTTETSAYDYCCSIITTSADAELVELAEATLDYAAAAQTYFGYNTDNMATKDNAGNAFYNDVEGTMPEGSFLALPSCVRNATMIVKSNLEINLLANAPVDVQSSHIEAIGSSFTAETAPQNGDFYVVHIAGIEPANMDAMIEIETDKGEIIFTANAVMRAMANSSNANLATLAKAMYLYGAAANIYFE